jgi:hypothetical protein
MIFFTVQFNHQRDRFFLSFPFTLNIHPLTLSSLRNTRYNISIFIFKPFVSFVSLLLVLANSNCKWRFSFCQLFLDVTITKKTRVHTLSMIIKL